MSGLIKTNTEELRDILQKVSELPEAGGIELPELTNEGSASDLMLNKELIDGNGNVITGTFTIDNELTEQDNLITQIQTAVDSLPEADSSGGNLETASVYVDVTTMSICTYVSVNGVVTIKDTAETIDVVVPSLCLVQAVGDTFRNYSHSGDISYRLSLSNCRFLQINGNGSIYAEGIGDAHLGGGDN